MLSVRRVLEVTFVALVGLSALLLGYSQGNWQLAGISAGGAVLAWVLVDWLNWFRMPRWVANVLSIGVLIVTMKDFFGRDSSFQLVAVANLLVYLQTILLFQEKFPRQYWQLAVLNLLQVVVATIFTLQFEGGFLFICYMTLAGVLLLLVTLEEESFLARQQARVSEEPGRRGPLPRLTSETADRQGERLPGMLGHLLSWALIAISFSCVLFVLVPRNESAWFGPKYKTASATGLSKRIDLDVRGVIELDSKQVFRVLFTEPGRSEPLDFAVPIYMRGMALGGWSVEGDRTVWSPPYDRLDRFVYEGLPRPRRNGRYYQMEVTMEPTEDPLLFSSLPAFLPEAEADDLDYCTELMAVTRKRDTQRIEQSPFKYTLFIPRVGNFEFARSWPFNPGTQARSAQTMAGNPALRNWLLQMDAARYPQLVQLANTLVQRAGTENHLRLAQALEQHFLTSREYRYTLDFTNVSRRPGIDSIEDFVANHKTGHCELYASALALMLRSQGIPAQVVVGYCGGSFNPWGKFYAFTNENAHAWVEAYIRPEDCTDEMRAAGLAGPGGAWLQLDPTPPANLRRSSSLDSAQALNLARSMWQEYVLGLDSGTQRGWNSSGGLLQMLRLDYFSNTLQRGFTSLQQTPALRAVIIGTILAMLLATSAWSLYRRRHRRSGTGSRKIGLLRRLVGAALAIFAPKLSKWLLQGDPTTPTVPFYLRLVQLLERQGFQRDPTETHREYLRRVARAWQDTEPSPPDSDALELALGHVSVAFHAVRFGGTALDNRQQQAIEQDIQLLERSLNTPLAKTGELRGR